ncbi:uncharacterized protein TNCV_3684441 [Trichonephila clavipes]|uniref:Integrase zinc-binding domain-containing protein n=1 Tax=Trichonephila clavipes TaxID=2585209 RepID=A0A8X6RME3_TRICX|nr:uncharacterized protein TNCV_3684441 [Trichonephila clavipes]
MTNEDQDMQMVLGLSSDLVSDKLSCKLPSNLDCTQKRPVTKRVLLSVINSVYDPIGFMAPALLLAKLLVQEAWRGKIGWDEFFEENGILKVQTRLILSQDPEDFTLPTVLPDHPLIEGLVLYTHRSSMHAGVLTTLAQLREKFWIPKGRRVVRAILRQCVKCKRLTAGKVNPDPTPLPFDRIHRVAAFQITGADLAGPLSLRGRSKAWIVQITQVIWN